MPYLCSQVWIFDVWISGDGWFLVTSNNKPSAFWNHIRRFFRKLYDFFNAEWDIETVTKHSTVAFMCLAYGVRDPIWSGEAIGKLGAPGNNSTCTQLPG